MRQRQLSCCEHIWTLRDPPCLVEKRDPLAVSSPTMTQPCFEETSMPNIPIVEVDQASADVQSIYSDFYRRMSFPAPPNFIKSQGHSALVAQRTWDLVRNVLVTGRLSRFEKETLFVAISH